MKLNHIYCMDNVEGLRRYIPDESIDLTVTSPPYDNLRTYNGFSFDFEALAHELYRVTKPGGVVVWVVNDATINGSETLTSFKQAIYFKEVVGFNLLDTMIYEKVTPGGARGSQYCYTQSFEYMFVLTKGKPKTFNPIQKRNVKPAKPDITASRSGDGKLKKRVIVRKETSKLNNIWAYGTGNGISTTDKIAYKHPAIFPEALAQDHILSWSNPGDIVLDPFMGSGTTAKMALLNNRYYVGFEISQEYVALAEQRLSQYKRKVS